MVQMAVLDSLSSSGDSEAVDPLDFGRVYTETDEPIETETDDTTTVAQEACTDGSGFCGTGREGGLSYG